ncbi:Hypothetical predicted protein [Lecanosticta acicola]|uniref:Uncharacterized protein n=1 Tax=Lecanosticta acicola TaxID=111012 RepID=A0AAI9EDA4_9PEZI|nr:Hypothetical predicted protein [Lecanosticta acicola]
MDKALDHSPAVCLRLIDDQANAFYHHCSLCAFLHGTGQDCEHQHQKPAETGLLRTAPPPFRTGTPFSKCSFYTAISQDPQDDTTSSHDSLPSDDDPHSLDDTSSLSSRSSISSLKAVKRRNASQHTLVLKTRRSLRRTSSPTDYSLRELHHQQSSDETDSNNASDFEEQSSDDDDSSSLRQQQSEEKLQAVYEEQILSYLNADYADLEMIGVAWCPARPGL